MIELIKIIINVNDVRHEYVCIVGVPASQSSGNGSSFSSSKETGKSGRNASTPTTVDVCVGTSVGTVTEPDCLGPCEPGTSVTLEGIVWHETESGEN